MTLHLPVHVRHMYRPCQGVLAQSPLYVAIKVHDHFTTAPVYHDACSGWFGSDNKTVAESLLKRSQIKHATKIHIIKKGHASCCVSRKNKGLCIALWSSSLICFRKECIIKYIILKMILHLMKFRFVSKSS